MKNVIVIILITFFIFNSFNKTANSSAFKYETAGTFNSLSNNTRDSDIKVNLPNDTTYYTTRWH